jgi:hypothetical protein
MSKKIAVALQGGKGIDRIYQYSVTGVTRGTTTIIEFSGGHAFRPGDTIRFAGLGGITQLNGITATVISNPSPITAEIDLNTTTGFSNYSSGGNGSCEIKAIQGITKAGTAVLSCAGHGFTNGQALTIFNVVGMPEVNNKSFIVQNVTTDTLELQGVDSTSYGVFTSGFLAPAYATPQYAINLIAVENGDLLHIEKTPDAVLHSLGNVTVTKNTNSFTTSASYTGVISAGDFIGIPSAAGNGSEETYYKVLTINATTIAFEGYYAGSTGVVTGLKKVVPSAYGVNNQAIINCSKSLSISGGWDLSLNTQNGETWLRHAFGFLSTTNRGIVLSGGCEISRVNIIEVYDSTITGGAIARDLSIGAYVYSIIATGPSILRNSRCMPNKFPSFATLRVLGEGNIVENCVFSSWHTAAAVAVAVVADAIVDLSTCKILASGYALELASRSRVICPRIEDCNQGIRLITSAFGVSVENANIERCTTGILVWTGGGGMYVKGGSISQCSTGINSSQTTGNRFEEINFSNNTIDASQDQYVSNNVFVKCNHLSPITRAYDRIGQSGPIIIIGCTIDPASANKVFLQTANDNFNMPQFMLQDSFGFTGAYYGRFEVVKNDLTVPPSVQTKFNTGVSRNYADFKVASTYITAGTSVILKFKLQALTSGWQGIIIPKVKLNQGTIKTEASITSISNTEDTEYEYSVSGGSILFDGELSIEFNANCNTIPVLIKEFEVVYA